MALALVVIGYSLFYCPPQSAQAGEPGHALQSPSYAVQAGLYVGPVQSNRMAEELIKAGYAAWVEERPQGPSKTLYFVLVGPFAEEAQAIEAMRSIRANFAIDPFIVDLNKR